MTEQRAARRHPRGILGRAALLLAVAAATAGCFTLRADDLTGDDGGGADAAGDGTLVATPDGSGASNDATILDANDASDGLDAADAPAPDALGATDSGEGGQNVDAADASDASDAANASDANAPETSVTAVPGCALGGAQRGAPWPMEGYCPSHRHRSPYHGPHNVATVQASWSKPMASNCESGVSIAADGTVYAVALDGVYAFAPSNGDRRWLFPLSQVGYPDAPGIGVDGTLYIGDGNGNVFAISPDGGQLGTPGSLSDGTRTGPTIGGNGDLYFSLSTQTIVDMIPPRTVVWGVNAAAGGSPDQSRPTIGQDGTIFVGTNAPSVQALWTDGGTRWTNVFDASAGVAPTFASLGAPPVLSPDGLSLVVALSSPSTVYELSTTDGHVKWSWSAGSAGVGGLSMDDRGNVYATLQGSGVVALGADGDAGNGAPFLPDGVCSWVLIDADGWLYVACGGRGVVGLDPSRLLRWVVPLEQSQSWSPADGLSMGADGTLYLVLNGLSDDAGSNHAEVVAIAP